MSKPRITFVLALAVALALALAAGGARAQGINLMLDDCSPAGHVRAAADCANNTGVALAMVGSVVPPAGVNRMVAFEGYIDVYTASSVLPAWWTLDGCRKSALVFEADFTGGPFTCLDYFAGQAVIVGGISPIHVTPSRFQIKTTAATPYENPIEGNVESYLFRIDITRTKSTGTGACAGCETSACVVLNRILLNQPAGVGDYTLTLPYVTNAVFYNVGPWATCYVPVQNRTWGQIKSLYR